MYMHPSASDADVSVIWSRSHADDPEAGHAASACWHSDGEGRGSQHRSRAGASSGHKPGRSPSPSQRDPSYHPRSVKEKRGRSHRYDEPTALQACVRRIVLALLVMAGGGLSLWAFGGGGGGAPHASGGAAHLHGGMDGPHAHLATLHPGVTRMLHLSLAFSDPPRKARRCAEAPIRAPDGPCLSTSLKRLQRRRARVRRRASVCTRG